MKKILIGAVGLFLMAACGGNKGSEMGGDGSNSTADSLAQEEALRQAHEAAQAALEQERLDSIREDSIRQKALERESFNNSLPNVNKLYDYDDNQRAQYLKSLGYEESGSFYTKNVGARSCVIKFSRGFDSDGRDEANIEITINGDNEALNTLYKKAQPLRNLSGGDLGIGVWKDKNTIIISSSW